MIALGLANVNTLDSTKVIPINDMFYTKHKPDGGIYSEKLTCVGHNTKYTDLFK